jgi:hypothetical protein
MQESQFLLLRYTVSAISPTQIIVLNATLYCTNTKELPVSFAVFTEESDNGHNSH